MQSSEDITETDSTEVYAYKVILTELKPFLQA